MPDSMKIPQPPKPTPQFRYAVLKHDGVSPPHFDLLFETDPRTSLTTWRSEVWPIITATPLVKIADHRREYLNYQGPVGADRGSVSRVASGYYRLERPTAGVWRLTFRDYMGFIKLEFCRDEAAPRATPSDAMTSTEEPWTAKPI